MLIDTLREKFAACDELDEVLVEVAGVGDLQVVGVEARPGCIVLKLKPRPPAKANIAPMSTPLEAAIIHFLAANP